MATITLNIPDINRVITGLCGAVGLDPTAANAKQVVTNFIVNTIKDQEKQVAFLAAITTLPADPIIT